MNNRTLQLCWKRMMERPLYRIALGVALMFCAGMLLVFGFLMAYLDLHFKKHYSPLPLPTGSGTSPSPSKAPLSPAPLPYPDDPNRPVEAAKRKMRMLYEFSEDATENQREKIEKLRK